jgi:phosphate transport system substrate-binding protein
MQGEAVSTSAIVLPSDEAVKDYIARNPGTIGYLSKSYVDARLKVLALDGILPTEKTITSGSYPLVRSIIAVLGANAPSTAQRLIELAVSDRGCQIAAHQYVCPR